MQESEALVRAVEELHEPERLVDLLLGQLHGMEAPAAVIEPFERGREVMLEWLDE